ncbi:MAG: hypothetical protein AAGD25_17395, partial [Cyanobacteria bacterium P01_F01_bin.150]
IDYNISKIEGIKSSKIEYIPAKIISGECIKSYSAHSNKVIDIACVNMEYSNKKKSHLFLSIGYQRSKRGELSTSLTVDSVNLNSISSNDITSHRSLQLPSYNRYLALRSSLPHIPPLISFVNQKGPQLNIEIRGIAFRKKITPYLISHSIQKLTKNRDKIAYVAFSEIEQRLVSVGQKNEIIKIWDLNDDQRKPILLDRLRNCQSITLSSDGKMIAAVTKRNIQTNSAYLINCIFLDGGRKITLDPKLYRMPNSKRAMLQTSSLSMSKIQCNCIAIGPRNKIIATGHSNNVIVFWDISRKKILFSLTEHQREVTAVKFSPDGNLLMSGSSDGTIKIWSLNY